MFFLLGTLVGGPIGWFLGFAVSIYTVWTEFIIPALF